MLLIAKLRAPNSSLRTPKKMRLIFVISALTIFFTACEPAQSPDVMSKLDAEIQTVLATEPEAIVGIAIRDAATGVRYDHQSDRLFHAASTMKVPVMIEVFRQASLGRYSMDDELDVVNSFRSIVDSSLYSIEDDSDDAIYKRLGEKMTIEDLVFQMITVSSNLATNLLIDFVSADSVQHTARKLGIQKMEILRGVEDLKAYELGLSNSATAADLAVLMEALKDGKAVSETIDARMIEILLAQAFNEMIPAGLPPTARVAHKTGQITAIHHDAAIIYPAESDPYVLVILIEGLQDESRSARLGAELARAVHEVIR